MRPWWYQSSNATKIRQVLYISRLHVNYLSVSSLISYNIEITCHNMAIWSIKNAESEQKQKSGFWERLWKSILLQTCFAIKMFGSKWTWLAIGQNRESIAGYSKIIVRKINDKFGKGLVSTCKPYASPKGTGPCVRRSKLPLSACHTRQKCSIEISRNSVKGRVQSKVWSVGVCHCVWSGHRMSFSIRESGTSFCLIRSPYRP